MDEEVSSKKFAIVMLGSLPDSYDTFLTSMNTRDANQLDWSNIKGALMEEYEKRKARNQERLDNEALFTSESNHGIIGVCRPP